MTSESTQWNAAHQDAGRPLTDVLAGIAVRIDDPWWLTPPNADWVEPNQEDVKGQMIWPPGSARLLWTWAVPTRDKHVVAVFSLLQPETEIAKVLRSIKRWVEMHYAGEATVLWSQSSRLLRTITPRMPEKSKHQWIVGGEAETPP